MTATLLPVFPESGMVQPLNILQQCLMTQTHFYAHIQYQNAKLHHLFKNKIKQTLFLIIISASANEPEKQINTTHKYYPSTL